LADYEIGGERERGAGTLKRFVINRLVRKSAAIDDKVEKMVREFESNPKSKGDEEIKKYFEVLGIRPTKDRNAVRNAYRSMAKRYHPDVSKSMGSEEMMKKINEAYKAISSEKAEFRIELDDNVATIRIENRFLNLYEQARQYDYEIFLGKLKVISSRNELYGVVGEFTDWEARIDRVERALFGKFRSAMKDLEKMNIRIEKAMKSDLGESLLNTLRASRDRNSETLDDARKIDRTIRTALADATKKINEVEDRQRKNIYEQLK
jgi:hypothetical protein